MRLPSVNWKSGIIRFYFCASVIGWVAVFCFSNQEQMTFGGLILLGAVYQVMFSFVFFGARWALIGFEDNPFE
jgi:hypothetical protein|tara:strand:+ start:499 stop:717 length:219 start_codon:yes stop_codon:yes gene_type:complete